VITNPEDDLRKSQPPITHPPIRSITKIAVNEQNEHTNGFDPATPFFYEAGCIVRMQSFGGCIEGGCMLWFDIWLGLSC